MRRLLPVGAAFVLLCACGAPEPLPPKPAEVPVGVDLSGRWQIHDEGDDTAQRINEVARSAAGFDDSLLTRPGRKPEKQKAPDYQVHVFLETGNRLKITQTEHGLFVSFDRAVVEEYRFGEQRMVSVGPVKAERVSGWEDGGYVIVTRDEEGARLTETYRLRGRDSLVRTMRIEHKGGIELDVEQLFDRI